MPTEVVQELSPANFLLPSLELEKGSVFARSFTRKALEAACQVALIREAGVERDIS